MGTERAVGRSSTLRDALYAGTWIDRQIDRLGTDPRLDAIAERLERLTGALTSRHEIRDALSGTWLGHPVHPALTDVPIGFWTSSMVIDLIGGRRAAPLARTFVALGLLGAVPAALTGANDWHDTEGPARRIGVVHGVLNTGAVVAYAASWIARGRHRSAGIALGLVGATLATAAATLGGSLVLIEGIGVDRAAFDEAPDEWAGDVDLGAFDEGVTRVEGAGGAYLVSRHGNEVTVLSGTCPHRGGPLGADDVEGDIVTCPWHGSRFAIDDGAIRRGPASAPLACFHTRLDS